MARAGRTVEGPEHLRLVASAIAGCSVQVVVAAGTSAWTDGRTIHLPAGASRRDELRMLAAQASLIAGGSLAPEIVSQMARRPALAAKYLAVEGRRALAAAADVLPPRIRELDTPLAGATSPSASLAVARRGAQIPDAPPWFGTIEARRVLEAAGARRLEATARPERDLVSSRLAELDPEDERAADEAEDVGSVLSSPVGGGGPLGRLLARMLAATRAPGGGGPAGADAATHLTGGRAGVARGSIVQTRPASLPDDGLAPDGGGTAYPEWDERRRGYRADWCTVAELDAPVAPGVADIGDTAAFRRSLARLGVGRQPTRRQRQGDDIDLDAAVEAFVDALAGGDTGDEFYVESRPRRRDLAVLVLLDVSGSAGEPGTGGRSVHEHQRVAADELMTAVHELGDRVALYGFRSRGRQAVQLLRVKAFDDPLDGLVRQRLDGLVPGAYTRLGAAIRHGTTILEGRGGTPHRLLVVLSDGFAYDHGYEGRHGEADARRALVEARRRGVGCLCLSVGADTEPAALRRVFGPAAHASVPRPAELPSLIGPLFRSAVRSAEARQLLHQRRGRRRERLGIERRAR